MQTPIEKAIAELEENKTKLKKSFYEDVMSRLLKLKDYEEQYIRDAAEKAMLAMQKETSVQIIWQNNHFIETYLNQNHPL
jgi:capsid protein